MTTGTVKHWNEGKGYGFIQPDADGGNDVFVHIFNISDEIETLHVGQRVEFEIGEDPRSGKPTARNVSLVDRTK